VTLRIEKVPREHGTTIKLIGRIRAEYLADLKEQIAASAPDIVLDLKEVSLVDADVVRFLVICESQGIRFDKCSAYIREWIAREKEIANKK
jgi:hypothetical protein